MIADQRILLRIGDDSATTDYRSGVCACVLVDKIHLDVKNTTFFQILKLKNKIW